MSGVGRLFPQCSTLEFLEGINAGELYTGIPSPGAPLGSGSFAGISGIATYQNLLSDSPPTLLEAYEVTNLQFPWGVYLNNSAAFTSYPIVTVGLNMLKNSDIVYTVQQAGVQTVEAFNTEQAAGNGMLSADIVNPIVFEARDRLTIQAFITSTVTCNEGSALTLAGGYGTPAGNPYSQQASIAYNVLARPARRRL